jgi:hypothetical protein
MNSRHPRVASIAAMQWSLKPFSTARSKGPKTPIHPGGCDIFRIYRATVRFRRIGTDTRTGLSHHVAPDSDAMGVSTQSFFGRETRFRVCRSVINTSACKASRFLSANERKQGPRSLMPKGSPSRARPTTPRAGSQANKEAHQRKEVKGALFLATHFRGGLPPNLPLRRAARALALDLRDRTTLPAAATEFSQDRSVTERSLSEQSQKKGNLWQTPQSKGILPRASLPHESV